MNSPEKQAKIDAYLARPNMIARMATVSPSGQPHVVPVWYLWDGSQLWVHSFTSTRKIEHLRHNPRCAITVDGENSIDGMMGVLIKGRAEIISGPPEYIREQGEKIYRRYLNEQELLAPDPQSWLSSPEGLILKISPTSIKTF
jgi:PPOX class probable F420-dependent enzyme